MDQTVHPRDIDVEPSIDQEQSRSRTNSNRLPGAEKFGPI